MASDAVIPSAQAFDAISRTVNTVLGEPGAAYGAFKPLVQNRACVVAITSIISGQVGRYNGKVLLRQVTGSVGNLAASDLGTQVGDAIVWYPGDIGQSSHQLDPSTIQPMPGVIVGWDSSNAVVVVGGTGGAGCTGTALVQDVVTSVTWNQGGNGKLQYQTKVLTVNVCGTSSISSTTTDHDVDTPANCS